MSEQDSQLVCKEEFRHSRTARQRSSLQRAVYARTTITNLKGVGFTDTSPCARRGYAAPDVEVRFGRSILLLRTCDMGQCVSTSEPSSPRRPPAQHAQQPLVEDRKRRCGCGPRCPVPLVMCPACPRVLRPRGECAVQSLMAHAKHLAREDCARHRSVRDALSRAFRADGFRFTCFGCDETVVEGAHAAIEHLAACERAVRRLEDEDDTRRVRQDASHVSASELQRERQERAQRRSACWRNGGCGDPTEWSECVTLGATREGWGLSWRGDEWCAACGEVLRDGAGTFTACGVCKRVWHPSCAPPAPTSAPTSASAPAPAPLEAVDAVSRADENLASVTVYGEGDQECVVCMFAVSDQVCVPCGHVVYCGPCSRVLGSVGYVKSCPVCRAAVRLISPLDQFRDDRTRLLAETAAQQSASEFELDVNALEVDVNALVGS